MTEEQIKYQKKKNALIYIMMFLLVAFVALICYIVVYSKLHPPKKYISQDDIAVVQMNSSNYTVRNTPVYTKIEESNEYKVKKGSTEYQLVLEDNTVKLQEDEETLTNVVLRLNDTDINGKIKGLKKGNAKVTAKVMDKEISIDVVVTDLIIQRPKSFNNKKK